MDAVRREGLSSSRTMLRSDELTIDLSITEEVFLSISDSVRSVIPV
jgi:hypothetical protein